MPGFKMGLNQAGLLFACQTQLMVALAQQAPAHTITCTKAVFCTRYSFPGPSWSQSYCTTLPLSPLSRPRSENKGENNPSNTVQELTHTAKQLHSTCIMRPGRTNDRTLRQAISGQPVLSWKNPATSCYYSCTNPTAAATQQPRGILQQQVMPPNKLQWLSA